MEQLKKSGKASGSAKLVGGDSALAHGNLDDIDAFAKGSKAKNKKKYKAAKKQYNKLVKEAQDKGIDLD